MIAWAAADVVEVNQPGKATATLQLIVPYPGSDPHTLGVAQALATVLPDGTADFRRPVLRDLSLDGRLNVRAGSTHLRIWLTVESSRANEAGEALLSLATSLKVDPDRWAQSVGNLPFSKQEVWATALQPYKADFTKASVELGEASWMRWSSRATLAVSGGFIPGSFSGLTSKWPKKAVSLASAEPPQRGAVRGTISVHEWTSPLCGDLAAAFASAVALGGGKQGTVYRVFRERSGWTYRQEAFLGRVPGGWAVRLIAARAGSSSALEEDASKLLLSDIDSWDEATLARVRSILTAFEGRGFESRVLDGDTGWIRGWEGADRAFGVALGLPEDLPAKARGASLEAIKEIARATATRKTF